MTEMLGTRLTIGGPVRQHVIDALLAVAMDVGPSDVDAAVKAKGPLTIHDSEANYGDPAELTDILRTKGVAFRLACEAKYEFGGSATVWDGKSDVEISGPCDNDLEAVIALSALRQAAKEGKDLAAVIAEVATYGGDPPALTIVDDEPDVAVVDRASLEPDAAKGFAKPWLVQHGDGRTEEFDTEDEACARQRKHREDNGMDPATGEPE